MVVTLSASQLLEQAESDAVLDKAEITFRADYEGMSLIIRSQNYLIISLKNIK